MFFCLCLLASPSIKLLVDDPIVVNPGEAITLVCVTTGGQPAPILSWARSFGPLSDKTILHGGTLTIPAITSEDAGTYSCVANNNVGNPAKKSTNIIVRGKLRDYYNTDFWVIQAIIKQIIFDIKYFLKFAYILYIYI